MISLIIGLILLLLFWVYEYYRHQKYRKSIPFIIHVNGTRGKSSVTRLIAAGLRAGGKKTLAKTTGSAASIIYENGSERLINRYFGANISEQIKTIKFASERKVEYLVLECMAVTPEYQWETEHKMVKADIGVITNSRLDHLDVMGPGIKNVTLSLCNTVPKHAKLFTAEYKMFPLMKKIADKMNTKIERSKEDEVTDEEMRNFSHIEHKENVALALKVCMECGVDRETALEGMYKAKPDVGAAEIFVKKYKDKRIFFSHSFAANDPQSTEILIKYVQKLYRNTDETAIVLSTRADRIFRSKQLVEMVKNLNYSMLYLVGEQTQTIFNYAISKKLPKEKVKNLGWVKGEDLAKELQDLKGSKILLMGIGNIHGNGEIILEYFKGKEND